MRKGVVLTVAGIVAVVAAAAGAGTTLAAGNAASAFVTNSNDDGPGSFRKAIERANADSSIGHIVFRARLAPIVLGTPVVYDGDQSLNILGERRRARRWWVPGRDAWEPRRLIPHDPGRTRRGVDL